MYQSYCLPVSLCTSPVVSRPLHNGAGQLWDREGRPLSLCVAVPYTHIHTHAHTHTHTHTHTHARTNICTHERAYTHSHTHIHTHTNTRTHSHTRTHTHRESHSQRKLQAYSSLHQEGSTGRRCLEHDSLPIRLPITHLDGLTLTDETIHQHPPAPALIHQPPPPPPPPPPSRFASYAVTYITQTSRLSLARCQANRLPCR